MKMHFHVENVFNMNSTSHNVSATPQGIPDETRDADIKRIDDALMVGSIIHLPSDLWTPQLALERLVYTVQRSEYTSVFGWEARTVSNYARCIRDAGSRMREVHYCGRRCDGYHALYLLCTMPILKKTMLSGIPISTILCAIYLSHFKGIREAIHRNSRSLGYTGMYADARFSNMLYAVYDQIIKDKLVRDWYEGAKPLPEPEYPPCDLCDCCTPSPDIEDLAAWHLRSVILGEQISMCGNGEYLLCIEIVLDRMVPRQRDESLGRIIVSRIRHILALGPSYMEYVKSWYQSQLLGMMLTFDETKELLATCPEIVTLPEGMTLDDLDQLTDETWNICTLSPYARAYVLGLFFTDAKQAPLFEEIKGSLLDIVERGPAAYAHDTLIDYPNPTNDKKAALYTQFDFIQWNANDEIYTVCRGLHHVSYHRGVPSIDVKGKYIEVPLDIGEEINLRREFALDNGFPEGAPLLELLHVAADGKDQKAIPLDLETLRADGYFATIKATGADVWRRAYRKPQPRRVYQPSSYYEGFGIYESDPFDVSNSDEYCAQEFTRVTGSKTGYFKCL